MTARLRPGRIGREWQVTRLPETQYTPLQGPGGRTPLSLVPFLQLDDQIDAGRILDTLHAEEGLDIDDADAPQFDEMPGDLRSSNT